jgi:hypothetical protein
MSSFFSFITILKCIKAGPIAAILGSLYFMIYILLGMHFKGVTLARLQQESGML